MGLVSGSLTIKSAGDGTATGRGDCLDIFREHTGGVAGLRRFPRSASARELLRGHVQLDEALCGIDGDGIASRAQIRREIRNGLSGKPDGAESGNQRSLREDGLQFHSMLKAGKIRSTTALDAKSLI